MIYEYIRISSDLGNLDELCALASCGWRFCAINGDYMLLEKPVPPHSIAKVQDYYATKR
jgi:hypothetical protein